LFTAGQRLAGLFFFEIVFGCAADGAYPVGGDIFKFGSGVYAVVGIAFGGVVDIAANSTNIFIHGFSSGERFFGEAPENKPYFSPQRRAFPGNILA
jgi:hypothetical protein